MKSIVRLLRFGVVLLGLSATAADRAPSVIPFRLVSAAVQDVRLPKLQGMKRAYDRALVIQIAADRKIYDAQPPSIAAFLYVGSHELRPYAIKRPSDSKDVLITFHDPDWMAFTKEVPMVLTTRHGDPGRNPAVIRGAVKLNPAKIKQ